MSATLRSISSTHSDDYGLRRSWKGDSLVKVRTDSCAAPPERMQVLRRDDAVRCVVGTRQVEHTIKEAVVEGDAHDVLHVADHSNTQRVLATSLSNSANRFRRTKLAEERLRCHARDGTKFSDQMRLVVVTGGGSNGRPAWTHILACSM